MIIIIAEPGKKVHLGRIGENEARAVRFDIGKIQAEFPGASYSMLNMRPADPDAYPVNGQYIRIEGNYLYWTLQSGDLTEDGLGQCEIKATLGGAIVKEVIWTTEICPALDGNGTPPEPWESWQQQVEDDADRAEAAAEDSEAWAVGERGGEPVAEGDETYHNNAKYWADQAEETLASKADKADTVLTTTLSRGRKANTTVGIGSLAFGEDVEASGSKSHAEGWATVASGVYSHAEGNHTIASNSNAHAEGSYATASGGASHAEGDSTIANHWAQHVSGAYNVEDPSTAAAINRGNFAEIVGNGSDMHHRSNARTLDWNGNERLKGKLYVEANADGTGGSEVAKKSDIPDPVDISGKADKVEGAVAGDFAGLDAEGNLTDSGHKASDFLTEHQDISGKADKVENATNGNLAGLDGSGNLTDSGKKASDFVEAEDFYATEMPMSSTDPTTVAQTATELKKAIDGKASLITDTVQNVAIASIPDGADNLPLSVLKVAVEPIQDLHGQDSPYPAGGGVNLADFVNDKGINTSGEVVDHNGRIATVNPITIENGVSYIFKYFKGVNGIKGIISVFSGETLVRRVANISNNTTLDTSGGDRFYFCAYIDSAITVDETEAMIFKSTDTVTKYSPYSNICPITGRTGCEVDRTGFNVWDEQWELGVFNATTGAEVAATQNIRSKNYIPVVPNTTYYIKAPGTVLVLGYDENKNFVRRLRYNVGNATFVTRTTEDIDCYYIKFCTIDTPAYGNTYNHDISISYPATKTDYTPYVGASYPISWQTEAGTVYGGTLTVNGDGTGEIVPEYAIITYNGGSGETWGRTTGGVYYKSISGMKSGSLLNGWANWLKTLSSASGFGIQFGDNDNKIYLRGIEENIPGITDATTLKTFLSNNNLQVCYPLATQTAIPLSVPVIKTLLGQNNVWADCGNILEMLYSCDTKGYIDKKLAELTALILENT